MTWRPPRRCIEPRCPEPVHYRGRCKKHQPPPWARHNPDPTRPKGRAWRALAEAILARDQYICYVCKLPGADQVDHIRAIAEGGAKWAPQNLAAIHDEPCHKEKSKNEARRGSARWRQRREAEAED